ncbi:inlA [Symbiodinium sp. CCMP2592]|nr:inlA [Symbiodinium sp. CCMP2592]
MFVFAALAGLCLSRVRGVRPELSLSQQQRGSSQPGLGPWEPRGTNVPTASLAQEGHEPCPSESELRSWLQALGLSGQGHPCEWKGVNCTEGCHVTKLDLLARKEIAGDLVPVKNFRRLRYLDLCNTQVSGDLAPLQHLTRLWSLSLSNTQVWGDLGHLQNLSLLERLFLSQTEVSGNLQSLQGLTQLAQLSLSQTRVSGDLQALSHLTVLGRLHLSHTQVFGDLANLQKLTQLFSLSLSRTQVWGSLKPLQHITSGLQKLYLSQTRVAGDLGPLRNLTHLMRVDLSQTQVSGILEPLQNLRKLRWLLLSRTQVSGEMGPLQHLTRLKRLHLSHTQASGNLGNLQDLTKLSELHLSHTQISGDLGPLRRLRELQDLDVSNSPIAGELDALVNLTNLTTADLSHTNVTGWFSARVWKGCCQHLRTLNLVASRAGGELPKVFFPLEVSEVEPFLPSLQELDVSGCELRGTVADFMLALAPTPLVKVHARACGLRGAMPRLETLPATFIFSGRNETRPSWDATVRGTLQAIDLSENKITRLEELPAASQVRLQRNSRPLVLAPVAVQRALSRQTFLDLSGTALANKEDMKQLLQKELKLQDSRSVTNKTEGWACALPVAGTLRITPQVFLPLDMCACQAGFSGHGVNCTACPPNTFAQMEGQASCKPCPPDSSSSGSATACECMFGSMRGPPGNKSCQCRAGTARLEERCELCSELRLECPDHGLFAAEAPPTPGYARLRQPSDRAYHCLIPQHCGSTTMSGCKPGYGGPLCTDCAPGFRAFRNECFQCGKMSTTSKELSGFAFLVALVLALFSSAAFWACRPALPFWDLRAQSLGQLLAAQAPALLQLFQLWAVLGKNLVRRVPDVSVAGDSSDGLLSYMEVLQLTGAEVQNAFALQCIFDAPTVRTAFALATPLVPLLAVAACMCLELFSHGLGISMSSKALTILFVGGASGAAQLLDCQRLDGEGKAIPDDLAFRPLFPRLKCNAGGESAWVDWVGWVSVFAYVIVVPCLMALLFVKQRAVMRKAKTFFISGSTEVEGKVRLKLRMGSDEMALEDDVLKKRLVAAAAAHVAVHIRGGALVELHKDAVTVSALPGSTCGFDALSFAGVGDQKEADILSRNDLMQMLTERTILEENAFDRSLMGTKDLLCKYAQCDKVWMEVLLKAASALMVAVATMNSRWLAVAVALTMAAVVAAASPFAQPQINMLQCLCFCCLALAAVGFTCEGLLGVCLTRLALLAPLLLVAAQLPYPDSAESLALRLQKELEEKMSDLKAGESIEVCADEVRLL